MKKLFYLLAMLPIAFVSCGDLEDDSQGGNNGGNNENNGNGGNGNTYTSMVDDWIKKDVSHIDIAQNLSDFLQTKDAGTPIFEVTNISGVGEGSAKCPQFTIKEPMLLFCVQTYHWNYSCYKDDSETVYSWLEDENGKEYGRYSPSTWKIGQGGRQMAYWYTFPIVEIPAGTYTVNCSSPETWSCNYESDNYGFCQVFCLPLEKQKDNKKVDDPISQDFLGDWHWGTNQGNNVLLHFDQDGTWSIVNTEKDVKYWAGTYTYTNNVLKLIYTYDFNILHEVSETNPAWCYYSIEVDKVLDPYWKNMGYTTVITLEDLEKGDGDQDIIASLSHDYYR